MFGLEGRYAHALYSAASKEKKLDTVEKDIKSFQVSLQSNEIFPFHVIVSMRKDLFLEDTWPNDR